MKYILLQANYTKRFYYNFSFIIKNNFFDKINEENILIELIYF